MTDRAAALRVGALLLAGGAAVIGLVLFLSGNKVRNGQRFESYFQESVQGLDVGAAVKFRGVSLGEVTQIGLVSVLYPKAEPTQSSGAIGQRSLQLVVVRYTIDPQKAGTVMDPDRAAQLGLRARLASQGITGLAYVELDFVNPARFPAGLVPWTPQDRLLPSMPSTITQVQDAGQALLAKLQAFDFGALNASVEHALTELDRQVTSADLPGLTAELKATAQALRATVQGRPVQDMVAAARLAALRLTVLIDQLQRTTARADDGIADLQQRLEPLLRDAAVTAANLRQTSETLRRDPASLLLAAPPPRGPR